MPDLTTICRDLLVCIEVFLPVLSLSFMAVAFFAAVNSRKKQPIWAWLFWISAPALCFAGRLYMLPTIAPLSDESEQMLAALTVLAHGKFFGQVFIGSHGPLVTLPLLGLHWLGVGINYLTVHILACGIQIGIGVLLWRIFVRMGLSDLSLLAVLPYFCIVAFALHPHLTTYNAEILGTVPVLLAFFLLLRYQDTGGLPALVLAGCCLGLLPHLKIQVLPPGFLIGLTGLLWIATGPGRRLIRIALFVGAVLLPSLVMAFASIWDPAIWHYYRKFALWQAGYLSGKAVGIAGKFYVFRYLVMEAVRNEASVAFMLYGLFVPLLIGLPVTGMRLLAPKGLGAWDDTRTLAAILLLWLLAALYATIAPGRAFMHYLQILVPVVILLFGFALAEIARTCPHRFVALLVMVCIAPFALASVTNDALHTWAKKSELDVFSKQFLNTLRQCTDHGRTLFVTDPFYGLYGITGAASPLPELTGLFNYNGQLSVDPRAFLEAFRHEPPDVVVAIHRGRQGGDLQRDFLALATVIRQRYQEIRTEKNASLWCRKPERLSLLVAPLPCSVSTAGFGDVEHDTAKKFSYRWTVARTASLTLPSAGRVFHVALRLLSPLFPQTVTVLYNGVPVRKIDLPRSGDPQKAVSCTLTLPVNASDVTLTLALGKVNTGEDKVLPMETRFLGIQILAATFVFSDTIAAP